MAMLWTAYEHVRGSTLAVPDPAIIGLDRGLAAAIACVLAAIGLMVPRARVPVAVGIVLASVYSISAQRLAGRLDAGALAYVPVIGAALYLCWPQLVYRVPDDD